MKYFSTRDTSISLDFKQVVLQGLSQEGGLFIPQNIPSLPSDILDTWQHLTFQQLCLKIFPLFINDDESGLEIPEKSLEMIIDKSFSTFRHAEITPLRHLRDNIYLLELFHGPTFAFKDVALQFLGNLFEYFLRGENQKQDDRLECLTILGATSGDTGGAAIESVRSRPNISIFMLHPLGKTSPIQKAQMTSVLDANVHNIALKGTFDDCQSIVKKIFADAEWKSRNKLHLGAVNSINWARILAQIVYYFYSYFSLAKHLGKDAKIRFSVPTGNFGDILAGFYAKRLGLPINTLLVATNQNDILHRFFTTGIYEKFQVQQTISPAMDIQISSNFERWLWYFMHDLVSSYTTEESEETIQRQASECVKNWVLQLSNTGKFNTVDPLPVSIHLKQPLLTHARAYFQSCKVTDTEIMKAIKYYADTETVILDPHSAVGVVAAEKIEYEGGFTICLATAHPVKFVGAVVDAIEGKVTYDKLEDDLHEVEREVLSGKKRVPGMDLPEEFKGMMEKEQRFQILENSSDTVKKYILETLTKENIQ